MTQGVRGRMGSGGFRGLQILLSGVSNVRGGFDSHTFPPLLWRLPWAAGLALGLLLLPAPGRAGIGGAADLPDSSSGPKPFHVMLRSTVVPGWGQATNHAWVKAAVVVVGEGFLAYQAYDAWQAELDATDNANRMAQLANDAAANGDLGSAAIYTDSYNQYLADSERYRNTKVNMIWWTAVAHLLQMVDAYVDAHFRNFDAEFKPEAAAGPGLGPRVSLALRTRF